MLLCSNIIVPGAYEAPGCAYGPHIIESGMEEDSETMRSLGNQGGVIKIKGKRLSFINNSCMAVKFLIISSVKGQTVKAVMGIEESDDEMEVEIGQPKEMEQNEVSTYVLLKVEWSMQPMIEMGNSPQFTKN